MLCEDTNFNEEELRVINSYEPLADWFIKNGFYLSIYELSRGEILFDFDKEHYAARIDDRITVLKKMIDRALLWIRCKDNISDLEKAFYAALAINKIYDENIHHLDQETKQKFKVEHELPVNFIEPEDLTPPGFNELMEQKLLGMKEKLLEEVASIDVLLAGLPKNKKR